METKKPWQSKTLWLGLLSAVAPFIPGVGAVIVNNPTVVTTGLGLIFMALRLISKGKIVIE